MRTIRENDVTSSLRISGILFLVVVTTVLLDQGHAVSDQDRWSSWDQDVVGGGGVKNLTRAKEKPDLSLLRRRLVDKKSPHSKHFDEGGVRWNYALATIRKPLLLKNCGILKHTDFNVIRLTRWKMFLWMEKTYPKNSSLVFLPEDKWLLFKHLLVR